MKNMMQQFVFAAACAGLLLAAAPATAQTTITCSSEGGRYKECSVDTRGGVRLEQQLSSNTNKGGACIENQTWGWDRNKIWVDRGCRARFLVGRPQTSNRPTTSITCSSEGGRYQLCRTDTRGGVRLVEQLSKSGSRGGQCVYNQSWGYDRTGIWVNNGCRARFEVRDSGWHDNSSGSWPGSGGNTVRCESRGNSQNYCRADTSGGVRLDHQLSNSPCRFHDTWGYDNGGIWVSNGCRADFELHKTDWTGGGNSGGSTVVCESIGYDRNFCRADTRGGVSLEEQLSTSGSRGGKCSYNDTWGYDSGGVWVRNGCRGRFRLGHPGSGRSASQDSGSDAAKIAAAAVVVGAIAAIAADQHHDDGKNPDNDWK